MIHGMWDDEHKREGLGDALRSIAREVGESIERMAGQVDVDDFAGYVGVDPDRAREWVESTASWLGSQLEQFGDDIASRAEHEEHTEPAEHHEPARDFERTEPPAAREQPFADHDPLRGAAPHPLDVPSEEQGLALAALESGRWTVEPGSHRLVGDEDSAPHGDAFGVVRELRARDWITAEGRLTLSGQRALSRWLDASAQ